jgi:L-asparagine transporter-like permease
LEVAFLPSAKAKYLQFAAVKTILAATLSEPDDRITVTLKRPSGTNERRIASWYVLALLLIVIFVEWRNYTIPALAQSFKFIAHRCGLQ